MITLKIKNIGNPDKQDDAFYRPFLPNANDCNIEFVDDGEDFSLYRFRTGEVAQEYKHFLSHYTGDKSKVVFYINHDTPTFFNPDDGPIFLVAQPTKFINHPRVVCIPLLMTDHWPIYNEHFHELQEIRKSEKKYDFMFIGQTRYGSRAIYRDLKLDNYYFRETTAIWGKTREEKKRFILDFFREIAQSKYVFCPRGVGSSSFRAYETAMVGSVPIILDMEMFPFQSDYDHAKHIDWDAFSYRGRTTELHKLIDLAKKTTEHDYKAMQETAIKTADEWFNQKELNYKICEYLESKFL